MPVAPVNRSLRGVSARHVRPMGCDHRSTKPIPATKRGDASNRPDAISDARSCGDFFVARDEWEDRWDSDGPETVAVRGRSCMGTGTGGVPDARRIGASLPWPNFPASSEFAPSRSQLLSNGNGFDAGNLHALAGGSKG
jgi:hypothetical protein